LAKVQAARAISSFGKGCTKSLSINIPKEQELTICHYTHLQICYLADLQIKIKPHLLCSRRLPWRRAFAKRPYTTYRKSDWLSGL